jgi:type II restriction enzyme
MFDMGNGRYAAPPRLDDPDAMAQSRALWEADLNKVREESSAAQKQWQRDAESDATHTDIQGRLRDLGLALGFESGSPPMTVAVPTAVDAWAMAVWPNYP